MMRQIEIATIDGTRPFVEVGQAGALEGLCGPEGLWEVELGFGKGRYLLARAAAEPDRRFLGVEVAREYFALAATRLARSRLRNLALLHGEALYLLAAGLPRRFASVVHVYFPDPWPKSRHLKRRLLSPSSVDLVLGLLEPGGRLCFATDSLDYGEEVASLLGAFPGLETSRRMRSWPEGARTNYEAKYEREGRPILRLEAVLTGELDLHPDGRERVVVAPVVATD